MTTGFLLSAIAMSSAFYVCGAVICRVRHRSSQISKPWLLLHVFAFALAGWLAADALVVGVTYWAAGTGLCLAMYIRLSRRAWDNGVPSIASAGAES